MLRRLLAPWHIKVMGQGVSRPTLSGWCYNLLASDGRDHGKSKSKGKSRGKQRADPDGRTFEAKLMTRKALTKGSQIILRRPLGKHNHSITSKVLIKVCLRGVLGITRTV